MSRLRLIPRDDAQPIARVNGQRVLPSEFSADILVCAANLPEQPYAINLCTDRYWFMVSFFAAIVRGQTNLLPSKRSEPELEALQAQYSNSYRLSDDSANASALRDRSDHQVGGPVATQGKAKSPTIAADACAAIAFTSGSTGVPQAHSKSWAMLCDFRQWHWDYLPGLAQLPRGLVSTVPAWHMYGLEWAMLLPTIAPITVHCGADFFPNDLIQALDGFGNLDKVLVATPTHLRALLKAPQPQRPVHTTISATAPLDATLSDAISAQLTTRLFEIYGCSEIGSLAWRAPEPEQESMQAVNAGQPQTSDWEFFSGLEVTMLPTADAQDTELLVSCEHINNPVVLSDRFKQTGNNHFQLLGRASDMIKVAGKRESLANLNNILLGIPGVQDGLIYDPKHYDQPSNGRLAAVVVAPDLTDKELRTEFAKKVDAAFVPRRIRRVEALPRAATSKLSHAAVTQLLQSLTV